MKIIPHTDLVTLLELNTVKDNYKSSDFTLDDLVISLIHKNKSLSIPYFLIFSYAYYKQNESLINDNTFDEIANIILNNYDQLEHEHKHLLTKNALSAGTGYNIIEYPSRVEHAYFKLKYDLEDVKNNIIKELYYLKLF